MPLIHFAATSRSHVRLEAIRADEREINRRCEAHEDYGCTRDLIVRIN
jgi:hypothetical protein